MPRLSAGTRTAAGTRGEASYTSSSGGGDAFLLLEIGDDILLESGDRIVLDGISGGSSTTLYRSVSGTRTAVT